MEEDEDGSRAFQVRRVSYLHSQALCSVKVMKMLFSCLWSFILFICTERDKDKVKGLDDGSRRAGIRCKVPQTGTPHKQRFCHIFRWLWLVLFEPL